MRYIAFLAAAILLPAFGISAQVVSTTPSSPPTFPTSSSILAAGIETSTPMAGAVHALPESGVDARAVLSPAGSDLIRPVDVPNVRGAYGMEAYIGYSFIGFRALPTYTASRNGFNYSIAYIFENKTWLAAEGEFAWTRGSQQGAASEFLLGMGGMQFRRPMRGGVILWVHGLAGGAQYTPQTNLGGTVAFGYELGGGADFNFAPRLALRVGADMVGTHFFRANQFSPKISSGVVFRF